MALYGCWKSLTSVWGCPQMQGLTRVRLSDQDHRPLVKDDLPRIRDPLHHPHITANFLHPAIDRTIPSTAGLRRTEDQLTPTVIDPEILESCNPHRYRAE